jgi:hypothetical protein
MFRDKIISFTIIGLLLAATAQGEVFKWTDEDGKVHYSDKPAKDSEQLQIREAGDPGTGVSVEQREERRRKLLQAFEEDRAKKNEQEEKQKKIQARKQRDCVVAKDRLKNYEKSSRLYNLDNKGNRVILSDAERQVTIDRLRSQIEKHCR